METGLIIAIILFTAVVTIFMFYYIIKWRFERRFRKWLEAEQ